jgi:4-hydroxy-L-threonine phosphate dehydrogenase PdxA
LKPILAVSTGDPFGIGPEICLKAAVRPEVLEVCRPLLIGDHAHLLREAALLRSASGGHRAAEGAEVRATAEAREAAGSIAHASDWPDVAEPEEWPEVSRPAFDEIGSKQGAEFVIETWKEGPAFHDMGAIDSEPEAEPAGTHRAPSATGGRASVKYIKQAVGLIRTGHAAALVTAPISKTSLRLASVRYPGHTELLADLCGMEPHEAGMLFVTPQFKTGLLSVHAPLKEAIGALTQEEIVHKLALLHVEHARWFGKDPRIAVAALNPHAGEEGLFGEEERTILAPAVRLRSGPVPRPGDDRREDLVVRPGGQHDHRPAVSADLRRPRHRLGHRRHRRRRPVEPHLGAAPRRRPRPPRPRLRRAASRRQGVAGLYLR